MVEVDPRWKGFMDATLEQGIQPLSIMATTIESSKPPSRILNMEFG